MSTPYEASANALCTVAEAKLYLRIPVANVNEDEFLAQIIDSCTARIERALGDRRIKADDYTEDRDGTGTKFLLLRQYPIISVTAVYLDQLRNFGETNRVADGIIIPSDEPGKLTFGPGVPLTTGLALATFPKGTRNVRIVYRAGYETIPDDLRLACQKFVAVEFNRSREGADGVLSETFGGRTISWINGVPEDIVQLLRPFQRLAV